MFVYLFVLFCVFFQIQNTSGRDCPSCSDRISIRTVYIVLHGYAPYVCSSSSTTITALASNLPHSLMDFHTLNTLTSNGIPFPRDSLRSIIYSSLPLPAYHSDASCLLIREMIPSFWIILPMVPFIMWYSTSALHREQYSWVGGQLGRDNIWEFWHAQNVFPTFSWGIQTDIQYFFSISWNDHLDLKFRVFLSRNDIIRVYILFLCS